jgi:hypothetical protein
MRRFAGLISLKGTKPQGGVLIPGASRSLVVHVSARSAGCIAAIHPLDDVVHPREGVGGWRQLGSDLRRRKPHGAAPTMQQRGFPRCWLRRLGPCEPPGFRPRRGAGIRSPSPIGRTRSSERARCGPGHRSADWVARSPFERDASRPVRRRCGILGTGRCGHTLKRRPRTGKAATACASIEWQADVRKASRSAPA